MPSQAPRIALDTNFVLNLAGGNEECLDCLDALRTSKARPELIATPTVLAELAHQAGKGDNKEREVAVRALQSFVSWGIKPLTLMPVDHGIVEQIADRMRTAQLVDFAERNDSFVIAEAALSGCNVLLSSDAHVVDVDRVQLNLLLGSFHVKPVAILRPRQVVRALGLR